MNPGPIGQTYLQSFGEITEEALLVLQEDGKIEAANPAAQQMLGLEPGASLLSATENRDELLALLSGSLRRNGSLELDSLRVSQPGSTVSYRLRVCPLPAEAGGNPVLILAGLKRSTSDLNVLEQAARSNDERVERLSQELISVSRQLLQKTLQLGEQKKKLSTIINGMAEGLVGCDEQGRIIHINETAKDLLALPEENVTLSSFSELCPELAAAIRLHSTGTVPPGKQMTDVSLPHKDLRVSVSPFNDEEGKAMGFVLIIQDRSQQAELDRMKADLISIVSHELRSPLTSIKGYVDLMMAGDLGVVPDSMKTYLEIVSANANRLAMLIDDMLDLSRIETGKLHMTFGRVDVKYLCDYVFLTLKPQAEQKKIVFHHEVPPGLFLSGDVDRLQQALTNLVSNAIKYTPSEGSVLIAAAAHDGQISISVTDSGIGLSQDDQKRLFRKFFRVKNEKTRNIGGTGLGLCIAKSIVEAHEGEIQVESEPEKGSTFRMILPLYLS